MFKRILAFDENVTLVNAIIVINKNFILVALVALASVLIAYLINFYSIALLQIIFFIAVMSHWPRYRHVWLWLAALFLLRYNLILRWQWIDYLLAQLQANLYFEKSLLLISSFFLVYLSCYGFAYLAQRKPHWVLRRPISIFLMLFFTATLFVYKAPLPLFLKNYLWLFLCILANYIWFLAYTLLDQNSRNAGQLIIEGSSYVPFWGSTHVPFHKGWSYLKRIEAKTEYELAITQLKGIKLIVWAFMLNIYLKIYYLSAAYCHVPTLAQALMDCQQYHHLLWYRAWTCLIGNFIQQTLVLAVYGHFVIGICRLAGFRALRNTYRPLAAKNIAEFWNRYYFYFKELLVNVFFYPSYFRYFKSYPRLRLCFATFAAAGLGNFIYHLSVELDQIAQQGLWQTIVAMNVYAFYCVILATAICVSQLRARQLKTIEKTKMQKIVSIGIIIAFYGFISIFNQPLLTTSIRVNFEFIASLFGMTI